MGSVLIQRLRGALPWLEVLIPWSRSGFQPVVRAQILQTSFQATWDGSCLDLWLGVVLAEFTLLKTVMQQVVSEYLLAIAWWVATAPSSSESSHTIIR